MADNQFDGVLASLSSMKGRACIGETPIAGVEKSGKKSPIAIVCSRMVIIPNGGGVQGHCHGAQETGIEPATDAMWDESKHPRKGGKFAPKGSGETFSKNDALAVHEATAKANWEHLQAKERASKNPSATSLNNTPMSDLAKSSHKLSTLMEVGKKVKPGANIKASGIGQMHRDQFKQADRMDSKPEYGPEGAKRHMEGYMAKTHPYHQGVIEAYKSIGNEAKNVEFLQEADKREKMILENFRKRAAENAPKPWENYKGREFTGNYDPNNPNHARLVREYRTDQIKHIDPEDYDFAIEDAKAHRHRKEEGLFWEAYLNLLQASKHYGSKLFER